VDVGDQGAVLHVDVPTDEQTKRGAVSPTQIRSLCRD
jgi:hypothetical protein